MVGKTKAGSKSSPDKVESVVTEKRKKSPGRTKSPARTKSPGRKSPARTSPARSKPEPTKRSGTPTRTSTRTRSPARLRTASPATSTPILTPSRRSPIRRSPARTTKESSEDKDIPPIRTRKQKIIVDTDTDSDYTESVPEIKEKPKATVRGRTRKTNSEIEPEDKVETRHLDSEEVNSLGLVRRFTRASQNREVERVVHLKNFESISINKKLGEFSDEDDVLLKKRSHSEPQELPDIKKVTEFGGVYGALFFIIAIPASVIALHMFCNESKCSFTQLPDLRKYKYLSTYFDAKSFLGVIAYVTLLAILTALPFGGPKVNALPNKHGKFQYVMNGLFSFVIVLAIGCGLELRNIPVADYIVHHLFHLLIASIFLGVFLSICVYVRSFYVPVSALNAHVAGKSAIYGFFMGREVNPRIFSIVDVKLLFFRVLIFGVMLIDFAFLYDSLEISLATKKTDSKTIDPKLITIQPTLLIYVLLHTISFLDALVFESCWVTTFGMQQEAFGYLLVMTYCLSPFITASSVKYMIDHGVELDAWQLTLISVVFVIGYILYRGSNRQKDAFRKNPYSPALSHLETIPTMQGKKLLVSGFWGIVRHPNYLGDILMHLTFIPFVLCGLPVIYPCCVILSLIYRSVRDNARCKQKYGAAWDRYCNKVKRVLIPKVY